MIAQDHIQTKKTLHINEWARGRTEFIKPVMVINCHDFPIFEKTFMVLSNNKQPQTMIYLMKLPLENDFEWTTYYEK